MDNKTLHQLSEGYRFLNNSELFARLKLCQERIDTLKDNRIYLHELPIINYEINRRGNLING